MLLFGTKIVQNKLPPERKVCPNCMSVTNHEVVDVDTRFTLYFFPLFSLKREAVYRCLNCGDAHAIPYLDYLERHEAELTAWQINKPEAEAGGGHQKQAQKEKARVILEGKVLDDNLKRALDFNPDALLRQLWIIFIIFALISIAALLLLAALLAR